MGDPRGSVPCLTPTLYTSAFVETGLENLHGAHAMVEKDCMLEFPDIGLSVIMAHGGIDHDIVASKAETIHGGELVVAGVVDMAAAAALSHPESVDVLVVHSMLYSLDPCTLRECPRARQLASDEVLLSFFATTSLAQIGLVFLQPADDYHHRCVQALIFSPAIRRPGRTYTFSNASPLTEGQQRKTTLSLQWT